MGTTERSGESSQPNPVTHTILSVLLIFDKKKKVYSLTSFSNPASFQFKFKAFIANWVPLRFVIV